MHVPSVSSSAGGSSSAVDVSAVSDAQLKALAAKGNARAVAELAKREQVALEKAQASAPQIPAPKASVQSDTIGKTLNAYA